MAANANGNFHSLDPPMIRKSRPTPHPTGTLMIRHLNIRAASFTWGSDVAIIEAIAQIGFVSRILSNVYQTTVDATKTLSANRIPTTSRLMAPNQWFSTPCDPTERPP